MRVWVCCRMTRESWDLQGVFSAESLAAAACVDATFVIGPVMLDEALPYETVDWPGAYFPKAPSA